MITTLSSKEIFFLFNEGNSAIYNNNMDKPAGKKCFIKINKYIQITSSNMLIIISRDWGPRNLLLPVDSSAGVSCLIFRKLSSRSHEGRELEVFLIMGAKVVPSTLR